ncbi:MAG: hypothetical protein ACHRXM_32735 [Isosphaerales bacterium]
MKQHREWYTKKGLRAQISPVCQAYPKCALALGYDPDKKELVVIEYPAKKKAMEEQTDREMGRK